MRVRVIQPPAPVVSLEEMKAFARVSGSDDDILLQSLVVAAQSEIDGPNGWLGRAIGEQTIELALDDFRETIRLPYPEIIAVEAVEYTDRDGAPQTAPDTIYTTTDRDLRVNYGEHWPTPRWQEDAVRVRYRAGTPADSPDLERLKLAIKLRAKMIYDDEDPERVEEIFRAMLSSLQGYA